MRSFNELVFIILISVVYALFVDQFALIIVGYLFLAKALLAYPFTSPATYTQEEQYAILTNAETTQIILVLVVGFAEILFGLNHQNNAGKGIAAGSALAIIYSIFNNKTTKYASGVTVLAILMVSLVTVSYMRCFSLN